MAATVPAEVLPSLQVSRDVENSKGTMPKSPTNRGGKGMYVINRRGEEEPVSFDQILRRIQRLSEGLHELVDPAKVSQAVINGMFAGIKTSQLDELAAQTSAYMAVSHPDFSRLAARIAIDNLHKNTASDIVDVVETLHGFKDVLNRHAPLLSEHVAAFMLEKKHEINAAMNFARDFEYDYFAFKTLERSYLLRVNGQIVERPQHMLIRVSCGIHVGDIERAIETYNLMSKRFFTHATPTLFNAGTCRPQMSSCFLLTMQEDSIDGIFGTLRQCALISKTAGGLGLAVSDIRASGSYIRGTNGYSNGLVPMLRVFNDASRYVDQGGGKRKGSLAVYLEPWHPDIFDFLNLRKNHGKEEMRARDLFFALWVPDLFMQRVADGGSWTLMCPNECPGLTKKWGSEFNELYEKYEAEGRGRKSVSAQSLWFAILQSQIETGTPFMCYKDSSNRKSNQQNLGTIQNSNLCCEIVQYTSPEEVAVCNLASLSLPSFVNVAEQTYDYDELKRVVKVVTRNLNNVIDGNYYPVPEAKHSNFQHRPIGIGVQGLADAFILLRLPFESQAARELNKNIFECIYFAAVEASMELAQKDGPYSSYAGSPASKGLLQFDLWEVTPSSGLCDWDALKEKVRLYGLRNSLLVAPMPTASTSQLLGNNEAFEPYTSNLYCRRVLSGEFFVCNPHLLSDLLKRDLWSESMMQDLIAHNGSVQNIEAIPADLKELYKTVWEIKQRCVVDMSADRGPFVDQSQSLNIHMVNPSYSKLSTMHFYGWRLGLKTGMYYLRTQAAVDAIKFTVDNSVVRSAQARQVKAADLAVAAAAAVLENATLADGSAAAGGSTNPHAGVSGVGAKTEEGEVAARAPRAMACPLRRVGNTDDPCMMCSG